MPTPERLITIRVKIELFSREGQFPEGRILIFFPENVKYRKLLCVKLLFSGKLSKTDPQPHFGTFLEEVDHCSRGSNPNPRQFYPDNNCSSDVDCGSKWRLFCSRLPRILSVRNVQRKLPGQSGSCYWRGEVWTLAIGSLCDTWLWLPRLFCECPWPSRQNLLGTSILPIQHPEITWPCPAVPERSDVISWSKLQLCER